LTGGGHELPSRQQTIRDAIAWSYDLLNEKEKSILRKLAVFAGGFTVEAAENVIEASACETSVLDVLTSLTENNLLFVRDQKNGEPRLAMLETIREFASEQLSQSGEGPAIQTRHAAHFTRMAEEAEPHLFSDRSVELLDSLEADIDNIRAALHFAKASDAGILIRLAGATRHFWIYRSYLVEGRMWLEAAIEKSTTTERAERYKLLYGLGIIARLQGDFDIAEQAYLTALDESKDSGNLKNIALLNSGLGTVLQLKSETARARMHFEEGLKLSRELGDDYSIAYSLLCLGIVLGLENKPKEARKVLEESLVILRRLGSGEAISNNLNNLGAVAFDDGDYEAARTFFREGLEISQKVGNKVNITDALNGLAAIATKDRELELAARLAGAADKLGKSIGSNKEPAEQHFCDAYLAELRSSLDEISFKHAFEAGTELDANDVFSLAKLAARSDGEFTEIVIDRKTVTEITIE
jgi:tetratricopeptide (TPR) repeat protein